jgi:D-3-phosphoglycerate dehydrogenase
MRAVLVDTTHPLLEEGLAGLGYDLVRCYALPSADLPLAEATGLVLRGRIKVDADFLDRAPRLRWIARFGSGMEHIDCATASARGIACLSAPEGNARAVAEHALGMLLSLTRRIAWSNREVIEGEWKRAENTGWELRGACIGIVGYGNTGPAFAEVLQGMGIRLLAHDKYRTGFEGESSLEQIQAEADVISFHLPLAAETKGYADYNFWKRCQRKPWVINTSRGSIMPLDDAYRALQEGLIRGLALDVLDIERSNLEGLSALPDFWNDFMNHPNVLITPHIAGWSSQAFAQMAEILVNRVANVAQC